jgi:protein-L-isoaspartate(D-aspartate) O-methyltransferase
MTSARTRERLVQRLKEEGIVSPAVLEAIRATPRHLFVDEALASRAYEDTALPIGHGQTISQPWVVARMTELVLDGRQVERILEVGTGCGYQTAVLAHLVTQVYTVERIEPLLVASRARLRNLGLRNVRTKLSDGSWGWADYGPYPAILVTAAPEQVPAALVEQLAPGGRLIIPVGPAQAQVLTLIERTPAGITQQALDRVAFVPLLGGVVR